MRGAPTARGKRSARHASFAAALAATAALTAAGASSALASGQTTPPHVAGSTYCETVHGPDYTLYGFVKGVSCATEKSFVSRCQAAKGLQGWKLTSSGQYGFILRKGSGTMDLQIAEGSPLCINSAI